MNKDTSFVTCRSYRKAKNILTVKISFVTLTAEVLAGLHKNIGQNNTFPRTGIQRLYENKHCRCAFT